MERNHIKIIELKAADIEVNGTSIGGTSLTLDVAEYNAVYVIKGNATLSGNLTITSTGTPQEGDRFRFLYTADMTTSGNHIVFFGANMPESSSGKIQTQQEIICIYDGSNWDKIYNVDFEMSNIIKTDNIEDDAVDKDKINNDVAGYGLNQNVSGAIEVKNDSVTGGNTADVIHVSNNGTGVGVDDTTIEESGNNLQVKDDSISLTKMAGITRGHLIVGDVSGNPTTLSAVGSGNLLGGDATDIISTGLDTATGDIGMTVSGNKYVFTIEDSKIKANHLHESIKHEIVTATASFETDEVGITKVKMPYKCNVIEVYANVSHLIAGADDGELNILNNAGSSMFSSPPKLITQNSAVGTEFTETTSANQQVDDGEYIQISTTKATKGGKLMLSIKVERKA